MTITNDTIFIGLEENFNIFVGPMLIKVKDYKVILVRPDGTEEVLFELGE